MNTARHWVTLAGLLMISSSAVAAFDGSQTLLCATQAVNECVAGEHCEFVTPDSVNVPDFFVVDATNAMIESSGRQTAIERAESLDGKLVLQGADDGVEGVRDGLGWTMVIDDTTGKMSLTGAGDGFAIVVFGACMER
jgi:hypothetical protein